MNTDLIAFRKRLRSSLVGFIEASFMELNPDTELLMNWHINVIAQALEDCFTGKTKRLIINVPPRYLKSHCVAVAFVAWLLGQRPASQVIVASYAQELADKHARDCRQLMASEFYEGIFDTRLSTRRAAVHDFETTKGGARLSTSVGGPMTGRGADFIIIDDPLKPADALSDVSRASANEWFDGTVSSRLNDKKTGCIILIMQRLHEDDLAGHLLSSGDWKHLNFPAIAEADEQHLVTDMLGSKKMVYRKEGEALHPEREPLEMLEKMRTTMSDYNYAGQYQQSPSPRGGGLVKIDWFRRYNPDQKPTQFDSVFQSWDTANTATTLSDYSACTTWGVNSQNLYLLDVIRKRLEYPELKRLVVSQAAHWKARDILIEDKASGTQLLQELRAVGLHGATSYKSSEHKTVRMNTVTPTMENGFVYIPVEAPWLMDFLHELANFPNGKHDDQADSVSQALDWFKSTHRGMGGLYAYYTELVLRQSVPIRSIFDR